MSDAQSYNAYGQQQYNQQYSQPQQQQYAPQQQQQYAPQQQQQQQYAPQQQQQQYAPQQQQQQAPVAPVTQAAPGVAPVQNGDGTSTVTVSLTKVGAGFGFTPFKYSIMDAKNKKDGFDFTQMINACSFAQGGLPVQAVEPNGVAARVGMSPWDVIVSINGNDVRQTSGADIINTMRGCDTMTIQVLRSANPPPSPVVYEPTGFFGICCSCIASNNKPTQAAPVTQAPAVQANQF